MALNKMEVEHVASLARLRLDSETLESMLRDLGRILDYMDLLEELDSSGAEPMAHVPRPGGSSLRPDVAQRGLEGGLATRAAPDLYRGQFRVPKVLP